MQAHPPSDESQRLDALFEYRILDTAAESSFDDIVRVAATVCSTPAAMVTFVDASRQWFKSVQGLDLRETHRDVSFCAHAIGGAQVFVVPDATKDARFADNPLVNGPPHIRYYAGAPLVSPEGYAVGTLAVIDFTPRTPAPREIEALQILSRQVVAQLELRRHATRQQRRAFAAENDLQAAAAEHRLLFNSALDAIITIDAAGRVADWNPAAEQLFGYPRDRAIGRTMADLIIPPALRDQHSRGLARYLRGGEARVVGRRVEVVAMRRDGTTFPAELSIQRLGTGDSAHFSGFVRDITERVEAARSLRASTERYGRQRLALTGLIQDERLYHGELTEALRRITETVASTLNVARVSIWRYVESRSLMQCLDLYDLATHVHSRGAELTAAAAPGYFDAVARTSVIAAADAAADARTAELTEDFLAPFGITSRLDARVHLHGNLHGVLSLEHVGAPRHWPLEEETFAIAAANLVSLALEGEQRRQAQDALVTQTQILTAVTESLAAYVDRDDWKEAFSRLLRCAVELTSSEYGFVGVVVDRELRVLAHEGIVWDKEVNRPFFEQALQDYERRGYLTFHSFDNLFGRALTTGNVVVANDPDRDPRAAGRPPGHPPMHSFLGVPIRGRDEITGLIALANRPGGYGPEERERIETLVRQAGALCDSYRQRERARTQNEERQQVEAALRASDERLRLVSRATNDAVWDWNLETNELFVPEGFRKLFGDAEASEPEMTIEAWFDRVHPEDRARISRTLHAAMDDGSQSWSDEYRFRRASGGYASIFDRGYLLRNAQGVPVRMIGAMMDVTDRKRLEEQFRQAQKLEAVGQLAGGVAHDFNNMLTVIQGHASLMLDEGVLAEPARDSVRQILSVAERGAGLTRQLLAFSRKQVLQTVSVDLNQTVADMTRLLRRILGEHVVLHVEPAATAAAVRADVTMMEQVILNLAINARDAMPNGGTLVIHTEVTAVGPERMPPDADAKPGSFVRLTMTDTGCGIPDDVLPHIFEPFFTTKGPDRGTGLGLATVYGIVKQHGGWIAVRSSVGSGTHFDVYLPESAIPATTTKTARHDAGQARHGHETILVVEDEAPVRVLARLLLERRGYRVIDAATGPEALDVWRTHQGRIDLVLTDMVMPDGLSGLTLAKRLLADSPTLKVIVTSGYSVELAGQDFSQTGRIGFLPKPYSASQLEAAIRSSLDA